MLFLHLLNVDKVLMKHWLVLIFCLFFVGVLFPPGAPRSERLTHRNMHKWEAFRRRYELHLRISIFCTQSSPSSARWTCIAHSPSSNAYFSAHPHFIIQWHHATHQTYWPTYWLSSPKMAQGTPTHYQSAIIKPIFIAPSWSNVMENEQDFVLQMYNCHQQQGWRSS